MDVNGCYNCWHGLWTSESSGHLDYTTRATFWPRVSGPTVLVIVFISVAVPFYDVSYELVRNIWALCVCLVCSLLATLLSQIKIAYTTKFMLLNLIFK